jgi:hypothetical protein
MRIKLIAHINRKKWWHVPPIDPAAYSKRGMFLASSFGEAEFYGRPLDEPKRVNIANPIVGDEKTVHKRLFGKPLVVFDGSCRAVLRWRWRLDAQMKRAAQRIGYDSIVILSPSGLSRCRKGKMPKSIELNLLFPTNTLTI